MMSLEQKTKETWKTMPAEDKRLLLKLERFLSPDEFAQIVRIIRRYTPEDER